MSYVERLQVEILRLQLERSTTTGAEARERQLRRELAATPEHRAQVKQWRQVKLGRRRGLAPQQLGQPESPRRA